MDGGRVAERGTYEELLLTNRVYKELVEAEAARYKNRTEIAEIETA